MSDKNKYENKYENKDKPDDTRLEPARQADEATRMAGLLQLDNDPNSEPETAGVVVDEPSSKMEQTDPELLHRRKFLRRLSYTVGGLTATVVAVPVVAFVILPVFIQPEPVWRAVGPVDQFKVGETVEVKYEDSSSVAWSGISGKTAAWLRRDREQDFIAYSIDCTHLGCPVRWFSEAKLFMCPCHGGVFYEDGRVAAGPPPRPLQTYPVRINNGQVEVQTGPIPVTTISNR